MRLAAAPLEKCISFRKSVQAASSLFSLCFLPSSDYTWALQLVRYVSARLTVFSDWSLHPHQEIAVSKLIEVRRCAVTFTDFTLSTIAAAESHRSRKQLWPLYLHFQSGKAALWEVCGKHEAQPGQLPRIEVSGSRRFSQFVSSPRCHWRHISIARAQRTDTSFAMQSV